MEVESIMSTGDTRSPPLPAVKPIMKNFESFVRGRLKVPAIGLLVAGIVNLLATVLILLLPFLVRRFIGFDEGSGFVEGKGTFFEATFLSLVVAICNFVSGVILVLGAARMFDLQNWGIALIAAVVALLPVAVGFPLSMPFGIWALLVLSRRDVRTAFADWDAESEWDKMMKGSASMVGGTMTVGMVVGLTAGAALDRDIGVCMVAGMVIGLLVGSVIDMHNRRKPKG
jgi:hypothetical protein